MVKSIILENISDVADENLILECVSSKAECTNVENLTESIESDLISSLNYPRFGYNLLFEGDATKLMEYLQIFGNYLNAITKVLSKCNQIALNFKKKFEANSEFIDSVLSFLKNLSNIAIATNTSLQKKWCIIKTDLIHKLLSFIFDIYETSFFVDALKHAHENDQRIKSLYDRCGLSVLIQMLTLQPVSNSQ